VICQHILFVSAADPKGSPSQAGPSDQLRRLLQSVYLLRSHLRLSMGSSVNGPDPGNRSQIFRCWAWRDCLEPVDPDAVLRKFFAATQVARRYRPDSLARHRSLAGHVALLWVVVDEGIAVLVRVDEAAESKAAEVSEGCSRRHSRCATRAERTRAAGVAHWTSLENGDRRRQAQLMRATANPAAACTGRGARKRGLVV
jgi:hypothetical protein